MFPSPLGHLRTSVKVEDDGDGLDGSVQAFERLGESDSMEDLGVAQPDTTEDDKRGAGYSVAAFNDTKGRVYRDDSMTVEIGRIQGDDPWYVEMISVLGAPDHNSSRGQVVIYRRKRGSWALSPTYSSDRWSVNTSTGRRPLQPP